MSKNFTAKHFLALAKWIKVHKPAEPTAEELPHLTAEHKAILLGRKAMHEQIVNGMCELFKADNPLFSEQKFRQEAGYDQ